MSNKPDTYNGDLAHLPPALIPLTELARWVVWSWELRATKGGKEKWTKLPRQALDPSRNARSNDASTWGTYTDAVAAVAAGAADGIGFMLLGSNIGAIDLDHCRDPESQKLDTWATQLQSEADGAYQEVTVSGGGLRIIGTVSGAEVHRKFTFDRKTGAGVELYRNTARYITVSGIEIGSCAKLPPLDLLIDRVLARHGAPSPDELDVNLAGRQIDYDDLIINGAPEGERSELFQAVVWHLAGQGQTAEQITDELARHPNGIGGKVVRPSGLHSRPLAGSYPSASQAEPSARRNGALVMPASGGRRQPPWRDKYASATFSGASTATHPLARPSKRKKRAAQVNRSTR